MACSTKLCSKQACVWALLKLTLKASMLTAYMAAHLRKLFFVNTVMHEEDRKSVV